jgi:hypothetical protein
MGKEIKYEKLPGIIRTILEQPFWLPELDVDKFYSRIHDDHDGTFQGSIGVYLDKVSDAWVGIDGVHIGKMLRFRAPLGGSQSDRVRNALLILAYAIMLDNKERPQEIPQSDT